MRLSKLPSAKVLLKLEFDTEDQVLFAVVFVAVSQLSLKLPKIAIDIVDSRPILFKMNI